MTDAEREELEMLRAKVANIERTKIDHTNPDVVLLEGLLDSWNGEYSALSVKTEEGGLVYLAEAIENLVEWKGSITTFQYHISSKPLGFYDLEEHMIKTAMGLTKANFSHAYSDLTGYLWTNEDIEVSGHNVLEEIQQTIHSMSGAKYIALRVERRKS